MGGIVKLQTYSTTWHILLRWAGMSLTIGLCYHYLKILLRSSFLTTNGMNSIYSIFIYFNTDKNIPREIRTYVDDWSSTISMLSQFKTGHSISPAMWHTAKIFIKRLKETCKTLLFRFSVFLVIKFKTHGSVRCTNRRRAGNSPSWHVTWLIHFILNKDRVKLRKDSCIWKKICAAPQ